MKFTFQIGEGTGQFPSVVSMQLNTNANYEAYVNALLMIRGIIDANINIYSNLIHQQDDACMDELADADDLELAC